MGSTSVKTSVKMFKIGDRVRHIYRFRNSGLGLGTVTRIDWRGVRVAFDEPFAGKSIDGIYDDAWFRRTSATLERIS